MVETPKPRGHAYDSGHVSQHFKLTSLLRLAQSRGEVRVCAKCRQGEHGPAQGPSGTEACPLRWLLLPRPCGHSRGWGRPSWTAGLWLTQGFTYSPILTASILFSFRKGDDHSPSWGHRGVLIDKCVARTFNQKRVSADPAAEKAAVGGAGTYQSTSKPLLATTRLGMCSVCRGSTSPSVGFRAREAMPATGVVSRGCR